MSAFAYLAYFEVEIMVVLSSCKTSLQVHPPPTKLSHNIVPISPSLPHLRTPISSFSSTLNLLLKALTTDPNQALPLQTSPPNRHMPSVANKLKPAGRIFPLLIALGKLLPAKTRLAASAISAP